MTRIPGQLVGKENPQEHRLKNYCFQVLSSCIVQCTWVYSVRNLGNCDTSVLWYTGRTRQCIFWPLAFFIAIFNMKTNKILLLSYLHFINKDSRIQDALNLLTFADSITNNNEKVWTRVKTGENWGNQVKTDHLCFRAGTAKNLSLTDSIESKN